MEMPTGKTIQTLRRQKGLTQEQLAEAVGVTAAAVSKWETASAYPDILLAHPGDTALKFRIASLYMRYMAALKEGKGRTAAPAGRMRR